MAIQRIRVLWTGFQGGPGISTFYSLNAGVDLPLIHGFFTSLASSIPSDVTLSFPGTGDILDETNGELVGAYSEDSPADVVGTNATDYAAPVGYCVTWETGVVDDGHRLRGRTYIVPSGSDVFDQDGTLGADSLALILGAAESLAADSLLVIWHRPRKVKEAVTIPAITARDGGYASLSGATVTDAAAVLTSRRD